VVFVVVVDLSVAVVVVVDDFSVELAKEIVMMEITITMTINPAVKMAVNHQSKQPFKKIRRINQQQQQQQKKKRRFYLFFFFVTILFSEPFWSLCLCLTC
jgi:hypothetical protein